MTVHGRAAAFFAVIAFLAALFGVSAPGTAVAVQEARLSDQDRGEIARIEKYLNSITSVKGRFLQVSSNGEFAEGDLFIARPGNLRIDYDPPLPILIIADGTWLIYYDEAMEQVSYVPLGQTPASILTRNDLRFQGGDLIVTGFDSSAGTLRVTVVKSGDVQAGSVTMVFDANPVVLRKWSVVDAQGVETQVTLVSAQFDVPLNPDLFHFANPNFLKPKD